MRRGSLGEALKTASRAAGGAASSRDSRWYCRFELLKAEISLLRSDVAGARAILESRFSLPETDECRARKRMLLGHMLLSAGDLAGAGVALDAAAADVKRLRLRDLAIDTEVLRGRLRRASADLGGAERHYREALRLAEAARDPVRQAIALSNLATTRLHQFRYDEALDFLEPAIALAQGAGARPVLAAVLANIALCQTRFGDFEEAVAAHQKAIEIQQQAGIRLPVVISMADIGTIRLYENKPQEALAWFQKAAELASRVGIREYAADMRARVAHALLEMGRVDEAERENAIAHAIQAKLATPPAPDLALNPADIACARGRCRDAVRLLDVLIARKDTPPPVRWRAHAALGRAHAALGASRDARRHFEAALAAIEHARAGLARTEYKLGFLRYLIRFYRDYVEYLVRSGDEARALEIVESSRAQLLAERAGTTGGEHRAFTARTLRRQAQAHRVVLLSYWLAPEKSQLWAVTADGVHRFELPGEAHIENLVRAHRDTIEVRLRDPLAAGSTGAVELYRTLVQPAGKLIAQGSHVVIAADGALSNLNFETLIVPAPAAHYWIEDVTISVTPALWLLDSKDRAAQPAILAFGDADQAEDQFPRLASAAAELKTIRDSFRAGTVNVRAGREATPPAWRRSRPEQFSMIHFAAHAVASRESPLDSAIILSPENGVYKLYTRDIAGSRLEADLVTVSACRSAGARAFSGEGLVGFAWAFLQAGARGVIAGLWDVSDQQTAELMKLLYRELAAGERPAAALRKAKLAFVHRAGNSRKPYNWAAFQLYTRNLSHLNSTAVPVKRSSS